MTSGRVAALCVLGVLAGGGRTALAADQGEIALVEDDGTIQQVIFLPDASLAAAAKIFYKSHSDIYHDIFFFWNTSGAGIQQGWTVYSNVKGIGRDYAWDQRAKFGVPGGKLEMTVKLGSLPTLPENPDDRAVIVPGYPLSGAELMGHEFGHHWLAAITYEQSGVTHCWIRGMESSGGGTGDTCDGYPESDFNQHWSYNFNSRSVMYGSFIADLGGGQFKFTYPAAGYSDLDQYLMGLRTRAEVDNSQLFIVDDGDPITGSASLPIQHGNETTVTGTKVSFTMDDVIASVGERIPQQDPCHRKAAFVIIHAKGQPPNAAVIAKMDKYRKRWEGWYDWATGNRGSVDTTLDGSGPGTVTCPSGAPPDAGFADAALSDTGTPTDSGTQTDAGYVACGAGVSANDIRGRPCGHGGEQCDAADSICGSPGYLPCHCLAGTWTCPAVDCVDGGPVTTDASQDSGADAADPTDRTDPSDQSDAAVADDTGGPADDRGAPPGDDAGAGTPDSGGAGNKPEISETGDEAAGCSCNSVRIPR